MEATVLEILGRTKSGALSIASPSDFVSKSQGAVDARVILESPQTSLYCLDDQQRTALFVETPPSLDPARHPFYYQTQYKHALRLLSISYDTLIRLGGHADYPQNLVLIYSVGRCGSTLLSRAFSRLDDVSSLSEPDAYTQITAMRPKDGSRDDELLQLLESCTRILHKHQSSRRHTLALKFRSFSIQIADLLYKAFPRARSLFLYRNAEAWARSAARAFCAFDPSTQERNARAIQQDFETFERLIPLLPDYISWALKRWFSRGEDINWLKCARNTARFVHSSQVDGPEYLRPFPPMESLAVMWLSVMDRYLQLHARGISMLAVRYETLLSATTPVLRAIFEHCNLPLNQVGLAKVAFAEDSQQGTSLARQRILSIEDVPMSEEHRAQISAILRRHPSIQEANVTVPGTLVV
jgi:hypothetical protein